jgi:hypothetical protein
VELHRQRTDSCTCFTECNTTYSDRENRLCEFGGDTLRARPTAQCVVDGSRRGSMTRCECFFECDRLSGSSCSWGGDSIP